MIRSPALRRAVCCAIAGLLAAAAAAQPPADSAPEASAPPAVDTPPADALTVGVTDRPPFAYTEAGGGWVGLGVTLWHQLAVELGIEYRLVAYPGPEELVEAIAAGEADVGIGLVTASDAASGGGALGDGGEPGAALLRPSYPYYVGGLGIAVPARTETTLLDLVRLLLSPDLLKIIGGLLLALLVVGFGMWLVERRVEKEEHFGPGATGGVGHGFWWAAVTMTGVGYGDITPSTAAGRGVAVVWMFTSLVLIAGFTAAVTSKLTLSGITQSITDPSDLADVRAATIEGSPADRFLERHRVGIERLPTLEEGLTRLADEDLEALAGDRAQLLHLASGPYQNRIEVLPLTFGRHDQAFVLAPGSPLAGPLDRAIVRFLATDDWQDLRFRHLGI